MPTSVQQQLADRVRADRAVWREMVAAVGPDRFDEPGPMGEWSFGDLAGHLLGWRERSIARLEAAARGERDTPAPWPADLDDDDAVNDWIHERDRGRSAQELVDAYDASFERLAVAIEAIPPEVVDRAASLPWLEGRPLSDLDPTGHFHDEHEASLRAWLAENG